MTKAEDTGVFEGADDFRMKLQQSLLNSKNTTPIGSTKLRAGNGNPRAREDFMKEFTILCKKYQIENLDFIAFVKASLLKLL